MGHPLARLPISGLGLQISVLYLLEQDTEGSELIVELPSSGVVRKKQLHALTASLTKSIKLAFWSQLYLALEQRCHLLPPVCRATRIGTTGPIKAASHPEQVGKTMMIKQLTGKGKMGAR